MFVLSEYDLCNLLHVVVSVVEGTSWAGGWPCAESAESIAGAWPMALDADTRRTVLLNPVLETPRHLLHAGVRGGTEAVQRFQSARPLPVYCGTTLSAESVCLSGYLLFFCDVVFLYVLSANPAIVCLSVHLSVHPSPCLSVI